MHQGYSYTSEVCAERFFVFVHFILLTMLSPLPTVKSSYTEYAHSVGEEAERGSVNNSPAKSHNEWVTAGIVVPKTIIPFVTIVHHPSSGIRKDAM